MRVTFRTDASESIGMGHFSRCLALADHIASSGGQVVFLTRSAHRVIADALAVRDHELRVLDLPPDAAADADAACSARAIDASTDWIVVDYYGLDRSWELAVRGRAWRLMAIDDLANRGHQCDVLLDSSAGREAAAYASLVPDRATLLLGPRFALLKPAFAARHDTAPRWPAKRRVHVFFGGGEVAARWLVRYCEWLLDGFADLEVHAVGNCDSDAMRRLAVRVPGRLAWSPQVEDMAADMATCDAAFGAPGSATWERACIGLPMAVVATAENQVPILERLDASRFAAYLGRAAELDAQQFVPAFGAFLADRDALAGLRARGVACVDGRGTERAIHHLQTLGAALG